MRIWLRGGAWAERGERPARVAGMSCGGRRQIADGTRGVIRARDGSGGRRSGSCGEEFIDGFAEGEDGHGSALVIEEGFGVIDAEVGVDGCPEVVGGEGAFDGVFAESVGGADDLTGSHAAAGHDEGHALGPVVASGLGDLGLGSYG